jgi:hypothetical protein
VRRGRVCGGAPAMVRFRHPPARSRAGSHGAAVALLSRAALIVILGTHASKSARGLAGVAARVPRLSAAAPRSAAATLLPGKKAAPVGASLDALPTGVRAVWVRALGTAASATVRVCVCAGVRIQGWRRSRPPCERASWERASWERASCERALCGRVWRGRPSCGHASCGGASCGRASCGRRARCARVLGCPTLRPARGLRACASHAHGWTAPRCLPPALTHMRVCVLERRAARRVRVRRRWSCS